MRSCTHQCCHPGARARLRPRRHAVGGVARRRASAQPRDSEGVVNDRQVLVRVLGRAVPAAAAAALAAAHLVDAVVQLWMAAHPHGNAVLLAALEYGCRVGKQAAQRCWGEVLAKCGLATAAARPTTDLPGTRPAQTCKRALWPRAGGGCQVPHASWSGCARRCKWNLALVRLPRTKSCAPPPPGTTSSGRPAPRAWSWPSCLAPGRSVARAGRPNVKPATRRQWPLLKICFARPSAATRRRQLAPRCWNSGCIVRHVTG